MYRICDLGHIFIILLMVGSSFYRISAYNLSITYIVTNLGKVYVDGSLTSLPQIVEGGSLTSYTIVGDSQHTLGFHLITDAPSGGYFLCYWEISDLNIYGYTGDGWYYYNNTSNDDSLSWLSTTSLEYSANATKTPITADFGWNYPGQCISTPTYEPGLFKTIIDLTTFNPTSRPSSSPTSSLTLPPTLSPTRGPTPPTRSPTPRPVQGEIYTHVIVKFDITCNNDCASTVLDTSIEITEIYLTNKSVPLKNNANFEKSVKNKNISIGLNNEDLGRTIISYCNQSEYKEQIASGTNFTATVRSIEIIIVPKHTDKAKKNLPLFAIIGAVVGAFILITLGLFYYLCYWRPKRIKEEMRDLASKIQEVTKISTEQDHIKKSRQKDIKDIKPHLGQEQLSMELFLYKVRSPHN